MTVVLDTSFVLAALDRGDSRHAACVAWATASDEDFITTPLALAEMDRLVRRRGGRTASQRFRADLEQGAYAVRWWADGLRESLEIARRHPALGLADASLVALANLLRTDRIATFDTNFRSVTTPGGEGFVLLPDDA